MPKPKKKTSTSPALPANDLDTTVTQAIGQLSAIETSLGTAPPITATDKRRSIKMRKGGEAIAATIGALAQQHQAELPSVQVAPMIAALSKVETLQPLVTSVAAFAQRLDDTVFSAQSAAWTIALQLYALLQRMAATNGALASALPAIIAARVHSNRLIAERSGFIAYAILALIAATIYWPLTPAIEPNRWCQARDRLRNRVQS